MIDLKDIKLREECIRLQKELAKVILGHTQKAACATLSIMLAQILKKQPDPKEALAGVVEVLNLSMEL